jgi:uncharacterized damage-inducible protein DinB
MLRSTPVLIAILVAPSLAAQQSAGVGGVAAIRPLYQRIRELYLRSAEIMPEENYSFRPVETVRTYGQLLGHVATENYLFCAGALGEKNPNAMEFEKTTEKAALIKALKDSFTYCDRAYGIEESKAMDSVNLFGQPGSRLWALTFNLTHDSEHYGNIVTYLRMKGLVPPSTQSGT